MVQHSGYLTHNKMQCHCLLDLYKHMSDVYTIIIDAKWYYYSSCTEECYGMSVVYCGTEAWMLYLFLAFIVALQDRCSSSARNHKKSKTQNCDGNGNQFRQGKRPYKYSIVSDITPSTPFENRGSGGLLSYLESTYFRSSDNQEIFTVA